MTARKIARNSTTIEGQRRAIITPVSTGTSKSQGEMTNVRCRPSINSLTEPCPDTSIVNPAIRKMVSEMQNVGTVV